MRAYPAGRAHKRVKLSAFTVFRGHTPNTCRHMHTGKQPAGGQTGIIYMHNLCVRRDEERVSLCAGVSRLGECINGPRARTIMWYICIIFAHNCVGFRVKWVILNNANRRSECVHAERRKTIAFQSLCASMYSNIIQFMRSRFANIQCNFAELPLTVIRIIKSEKNLNILYVTIHNIYAIVCTSRMCLFSCTLIIYICLVRW